jgi:chorismate mutase
MSQKNILKIRSTIDTIDKQIIKLLGLRKKQVLKIAKYKNKRTIVDKKRINQIMKRIKAEAKKNKVDFTLVKNFWNKLIQYSIKLEKKIVK